MMFDYLIVGAGFAGSVLAERLASQLDQRVLLIDRRNHVGGNAYDHYNDDGLLVHKYGPHIFHTNSQQVFEYLSHFTQWRAYQHRVLASVDGQLVPMPINLDTINQLYGLHLNAFQLEEFFASVAEPRESIRTSEDVVVSKVGRELYQKFFRNYTLKQWGLDPSELDASVTARVPTRTNRDSRYFTDKYQAMPLHGYTRLFEKMLIASEYQGDAEHRLPRNSGDNSASPPDLHRPHRRVLRLLLRQTSLSLAAVRVRNVQYLAVAQPAAVVNYPNDYRLHAHHGV